MIDQYTTLLDMSLLHVLLSTYNYPLCLVPFKNVCSWSFTRIKSFLATFDNSFNGISSAFFINLETSDYVGRHTSYH